MMAMLRHCKNKATKRDFGITNVYISSERVWGFALLLSRGMLLNEQSNDWWLETSWRSCGVTVITTPFRYYKWLRIAGTSREKNRHRYSGVPVVGPPGFFFIPPADHREWLVLSAHLALLSWSPLISISGTQVEIRFITAWKNSSDVIKSHRFLFFVKFGVESKLEWSFYDQY